MVRGAPDSDRLRRRDQHGRTRRRRLCRRHEPRHAPGTDEDDGLGHRLPERRAVQIQEHQAQGGQPRLSSMVRFGLKGWRLRIPAALNAGQQVDVLLDSDRRPVLQDSVVRRAADSVSCRRHRPQDSRIGRPLERLSCRRHARDDVHPGRVRTGGDRRPPVHRRRHARQRPGRSRPQDGRRCRHRHRRWLQARRAQDQRIVVQAISDARSTR